MSNETCACPHWDAYECAVIRYGRDNFDLEDDLVWGEP